VPLLSLGAITAVLWVIHQLNPPPSPISEQLQREFELAAAEGKSVSFNKQIDLHGTGRDSSVVVFQPVKTVQSAQAPSDELRIYDVIDEKLVRRFTFRSTSGEGVSYSLTPVTAEDIDANGSLELIVPTSRDFANSRFHSPYLIHWDAREDRYEANAVLGKGKPWPPGRKYQAFVNAPIALPPPNFSLRPRAYAARVKQMYSKAIVIRNSGDGTSQASYATSGFILRSTPGSRILVGGFIVRARGSAYRWTPEGESWHLQASPPRGEPAGYSCFTGPPNGVPPLPGADLAFVRLGWTDTIESGLARLWRETPGLLSC
jgi:hypothetical protein